MAIALQHYTLGLFARRQEVVTNTCNAEVLA